VGGNREQLSEMCYWKVHCSGQKVKWEGVEGRALKEFKVPWKSARGSKFPAG